MRLTIFNKKSGFSLVELIIVILLIAILAAVAIPRFINASDDAKANTIEQLVGQIQATVELNFGLAQVKGLVNGEQEVTLDIGAFSFNEGYPQNKSEATSPNQYFFDLMALSGGALVVEEQSDTQRKLTLGQLRIFENDAVSRIGYGSGELDGDNCYAEYALSATGDMSVTYDISGCN